MEKGKDKNTENTPNSLTFLMFPFHYEKAAHSASNASLLDFGPDSIWEQSDAKIENNVMYEYIRPNVESISTPYLVYSIKKSPESELAKKRINRIWNKINVQFTSEEKTYRVDFKKENGNWNSARLVISPSTNVGLLCLGVGIKKDKNENNENGKDKNKNGIPVDDVVDFSYNIRKIDGQVKLILEGYNTDKSSKGYNETRQKNLEEIVRTLNSKHLKTGECQLKDIVMFLLQDIQDVTLFDNGRGHIFNYFNELRDTGELTDEDKTNIIHLTRAENKKYQPLETEFSESGAYTATFRNIYCGCSTEGGVIYTLRNNSNSDAFISKFPLGALQHRYLWLYIMALIQRHSLLRMILMIHNLDISTFSKEVRKEFNHKYGYLCKIMASGYFSNVSSLAQHNQYYNFCLRNLQVNSLYDEVSGKMKTLDAYLELCRNEMQENKAEFQEKIAKIGLVISVLAGLFALPQTASALCTQKISFKDYIIPLLIMTPFVISIFRIWKSKK